MKNTDVLCILYIVVCSNNTQGSYLTTALDFDSNLSRGLFDSTGQLSLLPFPQPRAVTKVDGAKQSFLSISDNNQTFDINPHPDPSLPLPPLLLCTVWNRTKKEDRVKGGERRLGGKENGKGGGLHRGGKG